MKIVPVREGDFSVRTELDGSNLCNLAQDVQYIFFDVRVDVDNRRC